MASQSVKTRFCPSPTGSMHLGNARTALFNALMTQGQKGTFLLRIEDTDPTRSKREYADELMRDLRWLGIDWQEGPEREGDAGPYWQSERQAIYDSYYDRLQEEGRAYPCFCTERELAISRKTQLSSGKPPRYSGKCRALTNEQVQEKLDQGLLATLRFRVPDDEVIEFTDLVRGLQRFATHDLGDFIIRRTDGTSPFMFCNAVDDALMGVTHVLRGEDHLTNTPRQLMIYRALGLKEPQYAHINLIVGHDGAPLSKRHGSRGINELNQMGYFPAALVNYLARLGHHYSEHHEKLMTMEELSAGFSIEHLGKSPARFDAQQLLYWQRAVLASASDDELLEWLQGTIDDCVEYSQRKAFVQLVRTVVVFPSDAREWAELLCGDNIEYDEEASGVITSAPQGFFETAAEQIAETGCDYQVLCNVLKEKLGVKGKALFMPLRAALTNQLHGPELVKVINFMGAERTRKRFFRRISIIMLSDITIYNTLTRQKEPYVPNIPGEVGMYVCGMTVYDYCHIGHARVLVTFDVVSRFLRACGYKVNYVRNITDIDDKIIKRANKNDEDFRQLTARFIEAMHQDEKALNVLSPNHEPCATGYIESMIRMIQTLVDKDHAYVAENGDIYFDVESFERYGELAQQDIRDMQAGARVEINDVKRNPLDFVLWKLAKSGEPHWQSPWGEGRPGWHIECSAMSNDILGKNFDIHGGGGDLRFPHHQNEIAQSEAANGCQFVNTWMHVGYVQVDQEKMSKSLGNFFTIREVLEKYHPEVLRYFMIASHYRSPINYSQENLDSAKAAMVRFYNALRDLPDAKPEGGLAYVERFFGAMADDFNTPVALAALFDLTREINITRQSGDIDTAAKLAAQLRRLADSLGILVADPIEFLQGEMDYDDYMKIEAMVQQRQQARADKDWTLADSLRDALGAMGVILEDRGDSTLWRK